MPIPPTLLRIAARWKSPFALALATALTAGSAAAENPAPVVLPPTNGLKPEQLGIIINDDDPLSQAIGNYYKQRRKIPEDNVVHIRFAPGAVNLQPGEFAVLKNTVDARLPARVQALALTWAAPYRVGCMSITSAFAFGYDVKYCAQGCQPTEPSDYADSSTAKPFDTRHIRPTMALAALDKKSAFALIERGIESDSTVPDGAAYLVETDDKARSVRKVIFPQVKEQMSSLLPIHLEKTRGIKGRSDVMFYFTGLAQVPDIATNRYLPGAVADHLTSAGGMLTDGDQMSALRWLEAGATGSYGTVIEPCAFVQKFPDPRIMLKYYLAGETLIEAYWKSVVMPGQGLFIGEPLARPYGGYRVTRDGDHWFVGGPALLTHAAYDLYAADSAQGPFNKVASGVKPSKIFQTLELPAPVKRYYRLDPLLDFGNLRPPAS